MSNDERHENADGAQVSEPSTESNEHVEISEHSHAFAGKRLWVLVVAVSVVVVMVVMGVFWYQHAQQQAHQKAFSACTNAGTRAEQTSKRLTQSVQDARTLVSGGEQQVADPTTVKTLADTLHTVKEDELSVSCDPGMSTRELEHNQQAANTWNTRHAQLLTTLDHQRTVVNASRGKKTLVDAQTQLHTKKEEARKLLADSEHKVADNTCREALQQAISEADQLSSTQADDYVKAGANLDRTMSSVTQNMNTTMLVAQQPVAATPNNPGVVNAPMGTPGQGSSYQPQTGSKPVTPAPVVPRVPVPAPQQPAPAPAPRVPVPAPQAPVPAPQQPAPSGNDDWTLFPGGHHCWIDGIVTSCG
ncbi:hypothetical protein [Bombiscardovia coagulans]|uniref:Transcriptional regulatory protein algP n=1 Tax=Bombiscardovia coagulans TaxID=686666 RepID=A0A261EVJ2_9BIFI|nr:hypothetical protein [Bombiscardovia coagulans]OZG50881.1 transcriptional regulatory protein algP precursor [Bombiscardovia coagulans]